MKEIIKVTNGRYRVNTYLIGEKAQCCYVIDPGEDFKIIKSKIAENFTGIKAILLTHGHFDHVGSVDRLVNTYNCPVYLSDEDLPLVTNTDKYWLDNFKDNLVYVMSPILDVDTLLDKNIVVYHTKGHSKGGVCFFFVEEKVLFSGDTLFYHTVGRTDLPGSSNRELNESLFLLKRLDDDVKVYPGHGKCTLIGEEKMNNPYMSLV